MYEYKIQHKNLELEKKFEDIANLVKSDYLQVLSFKDSSTHEFPRMYHMVLEKSKKDLHLHLSPYNARRINRLGFNICGYEFRGNEPFIFIQANY